MDGLGEDWNAFGGENWNQRSLANEVIETFPEHLDQFWDSEDSCLLDFGKSLGDVFLESFFSEVFKKYMFVHVLLASI